MTKFTAIAAVVVATLVSYVAGECANACNGHGKCTSYDMCICAANWQANDCSERVCQFGLAHVDTPKGDLDMSGDISGPDSPLIDNSFAYPYGTTEQFPQMENSNLEKITESAHYYMECSNKGTCDRTKGECVCYTGYDGVACQRASCPGYPASCSGHGVCASKKQLAQSDNYNVYKLWDRDSTMGCDCDAGYYGPDCSLRMCKSGVDPLYFDDVATVKHATWNFGILTTQKLKTGSDKNIVETGKDQMEFFTDGHAQAGVGYYAIRFFDTQGEDWLTGPIRATAGCDEIVAALEGIPNNVIPANSLVCRQEIGIDEKESNGWDDDQPNLGSDVNDDHHNGINQRNSPNDGLLVGDLAGDHWKSNGQDPEGNLAHANHVGGDHNKIEHVQNRLNFWEATYWKPHSGPTTNYPTTNGGMAGIASQGLDVGSVSIDGTDPLQAIGVKVDTMNAGADDDADDNSNRQYSAYGDLPTLTGTITRIGFYGNPGALQEPIIEIYLDGKRPSITSPNGKLITKVWTDGQQGESSDYFADHCDGVTARFAVHYDVDTGTPPAEVNTITSPGYFLSGLTIAEKKLLKKCLGDSDFNTANNVEVYNWDYGNMYYPHIVKFVRTVTSHNDGGYYAAIWWDIVVDWDNTGSVGTGTNSHEEGGTFRIVNPMSFMNDNNDCASHTCTGTDDYEVYTTKATLALTSNMSQAVFGLATRNFYTVNPDFDMMNSSSFNDITSTNVDTWKYDGDISCEIGQNNAYKMKYIFHCLNKTDMFTVLNWGTPKENPAHINLYTATRLFTHTSDFSVFDKEFLDPADPDASAGNPNFFDRSAKQGLFDQNSYDPKEASRRRLHGNANSDLAYMTHVVNSDISTNWATTSTWDAAGSPFWIYKFFPARESTYNYVGECSNRGICATDTGICKCFPGYTNDDCSIQDSIAL